VPDLGFSIYRPTRNISKLLTQPAQDPGTSTYSLGVRSEKNISFRACADFNGRKFAIIDLPPIWPRRHRDKHHRWNWAYRVA
jgi:hypothetical protein